MNQKRVHLLYKYLEIENHKSLHYSIWLIKVWGSQSFLPYNLRPYFFSPLRSKWQREKLNAKSISVEMTKGREVKTRDKKCKKLDSLTNLVTGIRYAQRYRMPISAQNASLLQYSLRNTGTLRASDSPAGIGCLSKLKHLFRYPSNRWGIAHRVIMQARNALFLQLFRLHHQPFDANFDPCFGIFGRLNALDQIFRQI